jgi:hypothetical protein
MQLLSAVIFEHRLMQSTKCVGATLSLSHIRQPDRHASGSSGYRTGRLCQRSQDMQAKMHFLPEILKCSVADPECLSWIPGQKYSRSGSA